jgi:hypothetical protein
MVLLQINNPLGIHLHDYVYRCGMVQLIKEPTRIVENSSTLIDFIITDMPYIIGKVSVSPPILRSDHHMINANIRLFSPTKNFTKKFYNLERTNIDLLRTALPSFDWTTCACAQENVDKRVETLIAINKENTHLSTIVIIFDVIYTYLWSIFASIP